MTKSYKDLIVWQKSFQLILKIYDLTNYFPKNELYGLSAQMKRAAVSVASNIAEGYHRRSDGEIVRYFLIAMGSISELETQLLISKALNFAPENEFIEVEKLITETSKILNAFIKKVKNDKKLAANC